MFGDMSHKPMENPLNNSSDKLYISMDNFYIDEIRISDQFRSGDEIKSYYDAARPHLSE